MNKLLKAWCDMDHYRLEEDIIVLNNVNKFNKILIKTI